LSLSGGTPPIKTGQELRSDSCCPSDFHSPSIIPLRYNEIKVVVFSDSTDNAICVLSRLMEKEVEQKLQTIVKLYQ